jgi:RNA polymerase sigma-70 factor (ECF subfamily)
MTERSPGPRPEYRTRLSLLERVKDRDQQAWEDLVYIYTPLVLHVCRRWHVEGPDADDVLQEVFGAVSAGIGQFRRDDEGDSRRTFRNWLGRIIRNKLTDFFRRRNRLPEALGDTAILTRPHLADGDGLPEEEPSAEALHLVCRRALELIRGEFEEKTWQAFWRTSVDSQPSGAVAAELKMTAVAVRKAKSRVLHRLKEQMGDVLD